MTQDQPTPTLSFADRVTRVEPSATLAIATLASELAADGADVVDLSVGEPDFDTPEPIARAGIEAIEAGHTGYPPSQGVPELREAIADRLQADDLPYGPDQVMVTPGAKQAIYEVVHALIDEGDEVVLLDPAWVSYEAIAKLAGGSLTRVDLTPTDFQLEPALDDLKGAVGAATELLIVNSPSNPTGAVYSDAALAGVRDLAVDHDVTVLSDEIYREITYGVDPTPLATLPDMAPRTVTVDGFSKTYAMTGWRLGYFAGPRSLLEQAGKLHGHSVSSAANFVQRAGIAALTEAEEAVEDMVAAFAERRSLLLELFANHGVAVPEPDGAFYLMIPVDDDDQAWCERALETAHVATVPGSAFGAPGHARLSYAASADRLREGVERLAANDLL